MRVRVRGNSMEPVLHHGDVVRASRLSLLFRPPQQNDLVVAHHPYKSERIIKKIGRVIRRKQGRPRYELHGINGAESTDSHAFGTLTRNQLIARIHLSPHKQFIN
jgi:signal peptidase I